MISHLLKLNNTWIRNEKITSAKGIMRRQTFYMSQSFRRFYFDIVNRMALLNVRSHTTELCI